MTATSLALPTGTYVVTADAVLMPGATTVSPPPVQNVLCQVSLGSTQVSQLLMSASAGALDSASATRPVTLASAGTLTMTCWGAPNSDATAFVSAPSLVAMAVGTVHE